MARRSGGSSGDLAVKLILQAQDLASKVIQRVAVSTEGLGNTIENVAGLSQKVFFISEAFENVQKVVDKVQQATSFFYNSFINSNVQLQEQLLGTQATLAATQDVFRDGIRIDDPTEAIQALEGPIRQSLENVRRDSLKLVGVTSAELVPLFQTISQGVGQFGGSLQDAEKLTIDFAAALGTLGIDQSQARFEVNSIFSGQISQDSDLAQRLGITNETVALWKAQGNAAEELSKRLEPFRKGNELASATIGGVSSNILEIFQEVTRIAGEPLLDPIVTQLDRFYKALEQARPLIEATLGQGVEFLISIFDRAVAVVDTLLPSLANLGDALFQAAGASAQALGDLFLDIVDSGQQLAPILAPIVELIANLAQRFAEFAQTGVGKAVIQITALGVALAVVATAVVAIVPLLAGAAGAIASFAGTAAIAAGVGAAFVALREPITAVATAVGKFLVNAFETLRDLFEQAKPSIIELGQNIADFARSLAPVGELIKQGLLLSFDLLRIGVGNALQALQFFFNNAKTGFEIGVNAAKAFVNLLLGPFKTALDLLGVTGADLFQALQTGAQKAFEGFTFVVEKFANTLANARQFLRDIGLIQEDLKPATEGTAGALDEAANAMGNLGGEAEAAAGDVNLAVKGVDGLRQAVTAASQEIGNEKIAIEADQSEQLALLQEQLNQGLITEREFQNERARITNEGIDRQLALVEGRASELRAQYEALTEEEKKGATQQLLEIQKLETEANQLRQQSGEQQLQNEKTLREQAKQDLQNAQQEANDAIKASVTQREIELQELRNQGLLSERELNNEITKINADRIDQTLAQERGRLAELRTIREGIADDTSQEAIAAEAEIRDSEQRILDLTKERLSTEQQLQEQAQEEIIRAIEKRAQAAQNAATRETQAIEAQIRLYDGLNASLEQQSKLLQAQADLRNAENGLAASSLGIAASLTKNERERQRLQAQAAAEQLRALEEQQAFENQSLLLQQELEKLAVKRRQTEAEIAEIQAKAALAQAEADRARTQAAFERGDASAEEVEAANLSVQAAQAGIEAAQQQKAIAAEEAALLPQQQDIARRRQQVDQQGQLNQARADVIQSLPENSAARRQLARQEQDRLLTDEQQRRGRSQRGTNNFVRNTLNDVDSVPTFETGDRALSTAQPQLTAIQPDLTPLTTTQETGNQFLEAIAANTAQRSEVAPITVNVSVNGGATNEQTGQSVASVVRSEIERLLDRASALQTA